eukprot:359219-Chlamydomonas_euryale.AAC.7
MCLGWQPSSKAPRRGTADSKDTGAARKQGGRPPRGSTAEQHGHRRHHPLVHPHAPHVHVHGMPRPPSRTGAPLHRDRSSHLTANTACHVPQQLHLHAQHQFAGTQGRRRACPAIVTPAAKPRLLHRTSPCMRPHLMWPRPAAAHTTRRASNWHAATRGRPSLPANT